MFRASQLTQDKAEFEDNGQVPVKGSNAGLGHLACSLRANRVAVICGVAPFGNDQPFPASCALHPTASRIAEHVNISLGLY